MYFPQLFLRKKVTEYVANIIIYLHEDGSGDDITNWGVRDSERFPHITQRVHFLDENINP